MSIPMGFFILGFLVTVLGAPILFGLGKISIRKALVIQIVICVVLAWLIAFVEPDYPFWKVCISAIAIWGHSLFMLFVCAILGGKLETKSELE